MSKPNLIAFSTAAGFFTNERVGNLREKVSETITKTVPFSVIAPMLFEVVMAYAAWNQHDGDFTGYSPQRFWEIFVSSLVPITLEESIIVRRVFNEVGLFDNDKIRSWIKFNRHLAEYEKIKKGKIRAAKLMHKKRERDLRESAKAPAKVPATNGHTEPEKSKPDKQPSPVARLIALKEEMDKCGGAPNARNAPQDRDLLKLAQANYRMLKAEYDKVNKEVAVPSKDWKAKAEART